MPKTAKIKILAPAGDRYSFLAAIAAGADAIYCGLKIFSARMEAQNFSVEELSRLNALARSKNVQVYVALNSLIKENEIEKTSKIIAKLAKYVKPHALIIQDPGLVEIARRAGFKGELHLSTLANCTFSAGLKAAEEAGFKRVVLPRELSIDEIKRVAENSPAGIDLEVFIHGALCYSVSGRCYWSSWFGGKSGLRGRCVQPCRRLYRQSEGRAEEKNEINSQRFFSCLDFSTDVLVKILKEIPEVTTWKIEGRKKSPHYVFYTVKAYQILRDHGHEPAQKKSALAFLEYTLGRPASHYNLLPQKPVNPLKREKGVETGSGLLIGRIKFGNVGNAGSGGISPFFETREPLFQDDLLRIGYEDDISHTVIKITRPIPKSGKYIINGPKSRSLRKGTPVFIVDRREKEIWALIHELENELEKYSSPDIRPQAIELEASEISYSGNQDQSDPMEQTGRKSSARYSDITLFGDGNEGGIKTNSRNTISGSWLSPNSIRRCSPRKIKEIWWFLPPVIWPQNEGSLLLALNEVLQAGAKNFVLNMPWQISWFRTISDNETASGKKSTIKLPNDVRDNFYKLSDDNISHPGKNFSGKLNNLNLWAGPFCNVANSSHIDFLQHSGFSGVFVSPELGAKDYFAIAERSSLPLGILLRGNWPLAISRTVSDEIVPDRLFSSPRGEEAWISKKENDYWVFPNWEVDISSKREELQRAGYSLFLTINEHIHKGITIKQRSGLWNWDTGLL